MVSLEVNIFSTSFLSKSWWVKRWAQSQYQPMRAQRKFALVVKLKLTNHRIGNWLCAAPWLRIFVRQTAGTDILLVALRLFLLMPPPRLVSGIIRGMLWPIFSDSQSSWSVGRTDGRRSVDLLKFPELQDSYNEQ